MMVISKILNSNMMVFAQMQKCSKRTEDLKLHGLIHHTISTSSNKTMSRSVTVHNSYIIKSNHRKIFSNGESKSSKISYVWWDRKHIAFLMVTVSNQIRYTLVYKSSQRKSLPTETMWLRRINEEFFWRYIL